MICYFAISYNPYPHAPNQERRRTSMTVTLRLKAPFCHKATAGAALAISNTNNLQQALLFVSAIKWTRTCIKIADGYGGAINTGAGRHHNARSKWCRTTFYNLSNTMSCCTQSQTNVNPKWRTLANSIYIEVTLYKCIFFDNKFHNILFII